MFKKVLIFISALLVIALVFGYRYYNKIYGSNVSIYAESTYFCIPTGSTFEDVADKLESEGIIDNKSSFIWVSERKKYTSRIKPGRYKITNKMSNNDLVNLLRSGDQEPVKLTFNCIRLPEDFAGRVSKQIEADSASIMKIISNEEEMKKYGLNKDNALVLFIPNTYEMRWNTTPEKFIAKMSKEYEKFWNDDRKKKADAIGLSPIEVSILASIIEQEMRHPNEMPRIAGVYMNRLKIGMKLEADPTAKFATRDFTAKRIVNKHLQFDSPYNTYKYAGLPPGPICMPMTSSIDAVLSYEKHNYIYFCAKEDFSGYHNFATTLQQHNANANKYRSELDRKNIH